MAKIEIEWLHDIIDCDHAGCSGGYAKGARVTRDGEVWIELNPHAACFGSQDDWDMDEVFKRILTELGHEVSEDE